jgi:hypothetical protein
LSCLCSDLILSVSERKLRNCVNCTVRTEFTRFSVTIELPPLPSLKFALMLSLISKLMVTCLDDRMVNTRNVRNGAKNSQGNGNPPPPPSLAQAITSILESRDEQTELLRQLVANSTHGSNGARNAPAPAPTTYSDLRLTTGFGSWSPSLGSCAAPKCRRPSSPHNSCGVTPLRGGPTTPPLALRITKCRWLSFAMLFTPTTSL